MLDNILLVVKFTAVWKKETESNVHVYYKKRYEQEVYHFADHGIALSYQNVQNIEFGSPTWKYKKSKTRFK